MRDVAQDAPFPTTGRISELQQVGRTATIDVVERRLLRGDHCLLFGRRRIGKSSIAAAAVTRLADGGAHVVDLDFSQGIRDPETFTAAVLESVQATSLGMPALRAAVDLGKKGAAKAGEAAAAVAGLLHELGVTELPVDAAGRLAQVAAGTAPPELEHAFEILELLSRSQTVVVFLDEVGLLTAWDERDQVAELLARVMRRRAVRFVFAGSHQRAAEELFGEDGPLHEEGLPVTVPAIATSQWQGALAERFHAYGCTIDGAVLFEMLKRSDGHPQDTMRLSACCLDYAPISGNVIDIAVLDLAFQDAVRHPTWGKR